LVPIFFVYTGSEIDISLLATGSVFFYGVVISVLAFIGKYLSALGALGKGMNTSLIGIGMVPRGEVGLIFVAVATSTFSEIIGQEIVTAIVWMVINTTLIAPILLNRILKKSAKNKPIEDERFESPVVDG